MAENHISARPPITRKPHRYQAEVDLVARFVCHVNSTHVLQSLWRGRSSSCPYSPKCLEKEFSDVCLRSGGQGCLNTKRLNNT